MPDSARESPIQLLKKTGLRPTRQRVALAQLLFGQGDWHFTAETVHGEAVKQGIPVSLATVYNTLHQFVEAGLLREVAVESSKAYFDTKTSNHYHFFFEDGGKLEDIPVQELSVENLPEPPEGWEIGRVDVLVRLAPKRR
jgi:Fur family transcriptional regulator, iron response regulator